MCGTLLRPATPPRQERKVVTVLFCDLVGFTARSDRLDPEDVQAILSPYHARLRHDLERHGGTVEKFIGDAVMALFGAPVTREDDPERAIRAALAIRDYAIEDGLELRIGITTGEALISLDARPADGEGMASGDVVNTAARLQSAAPVNGILIDEATYRSTRTVVDVREAEDIRVKGKSGSLPVWEVIDARSRFGSDVTHDARSALVGREIELGILRDAFDRARYERIPQLVTVVGVPGIGKSRLVHEMWRIVDAESEFIGWRQGRCLAYGDGAVFWALAEIVKAQAGILDQDDAATAGDRLRETIGGAIDDPAQARWVESHLRPLIGLETVQGFGGDRRGEAFAAWRRALEAFAEYRPLVLVIEDLHWADDALLDFLDELVAWLTDVPLLVIATARPELLERRPGWGGGKLNATTLALTPLSREQTAVLLAEAIGSPDLPSDVQHNLLERADGNPLYAEQYARLYVEQGAAGDSSMPETLQGIVSARLDTLSVAEKAVLQDGAVMGKVFWTGAVRPSEEAGTLLLGLARKGFVTRQRRSSVERETEWSFAHILLRDASYAQIPRAERSEKHRRAAEWIARQGRPDDHAELLAHHWGSALRLAEAAGLDTSDLTEPARLALRAAGDRSFAVSAFRPALAYYAEALARWPADADDRPELLFRYARALDAVGDSRSVTALETARDALLAAGASERAAEAETQLADGEWLHGRRDEAYAHLERAQALIAGGEASPARARVLSAASRYLALAGRSEEAIAVGRQALAMAEALGLDEVQAHALCNLSIAERAIGDPSADDDLAHSIEIARAINSVELGRGLNNLAMAAVEKGDFPTAVTLLEEAVAFDEGIGSPTYARFARGGRIARLVDVGRWDEAMTAADLFIAESEIDPHYQEVSARVARASMLFARGDLAGADADSRIVMSLARQAKDPQTLVPAIACRVLVEAVLGHADTASELRAEIKEVVATAGGRASFYVFGWWLADTAGLSTDYLHQLDRADSPYGQAARALEDGDLDRAADLFAAMSARPNEAYVRLLAAERSIAAGDEAAARRQLRFALAFYREVRATLFIERAEALSAGVRREG